MIIIVFSFINHQNALNGKEITSGGKSYSYKVTPLRN
jgi:hypothetical protein